MPFFSRTTRLTDEGSRYYANSVKILRLVEQAGDEARGKRGAPAGTIRISCTAAFGVLHVSRLIFAFQDRYTDIGSRSQPHRRAGRPCPGGRRYRASPGPAHRQRHEAAGPRPVPASAGGSASLSVGARETGRPQDLSAHEGIRMSNVAGSDTLALQGPDGEPHAVPFGGRFRVDHGLAAREALVAGRGIAPANRARAQPPTGSCAQQYGRRHAYAQT